MIQLLVSIKDRLAQQLGDFDISTAFRQIENWAKDPSNGLMQPGDIIYSVVPGTKVRPGFYLCDGTTYKVAAVNIALQRALGQTGTTLTVPNLLNEFVRGGTTAGTTGGTTQHTHPLSSNGQALIRQAGTQLAGVQVATGGYTASWSITATSSGAGGAVSGAQSLNGNTDANTANNALPPYTTLVPWIKY